MTRRAHGICKRKAGDLKTGDVIEAFGLRLKISQVYDYPATELGNGVFLPACILLFFEGTDQTLSIEPNERIKLCPMH
jgi:hypothetical protein